MATVKQLESEEVPMTDPGKDLIKSSDLRFSPSGHLRRQETFYLYAKTALLFYSWVCLGLYSEVLGPSLPNLMLRNKSNWEMIGRALACRATGLFVGSLVGGFLNDLFQRQRNWIMCGALLLAGLTTVLVSFCRDFTLLSTVLFFAGCAHGFHTTSGNPSLAELWQEKASGPFNFMHAGYGMGGAVAPVLLMPFSHYPPSNASSNETVLNGTDIRNVPIVELEKPYCLVAAFTLVGACMFAVFGCAANPLDRRHKGMWANIRSRSQVISSTNQESPTTPKSEQDQTPSPNCRSVLHNLGTRFLLILRQNMQPVTVTLMVAVFCIYFAIVGNERVIGKFMFAYATKGQLAFTDQKGYLLSVLYWVAFCMARIITFFIALKLRVQWLLLVELLGTVGAALIIAVVPSNGEVFLTFSTLLGLFKSPLFPTTLGVINRYTEITGIAILVVNVGSSLGAIALQYLAGYLIENFGQMVFPYLVLSSAVFLLGISSCLLVLGHRMGDRFKVKNESEKG